VARSSVGVDPLTKVAEQRSGAMTAEENMYVRFDAESILSCC
jgi:hypothetical protein